MEVIVEDKVVETYNVHAESPSGENIFQRIMMAVCELKLVGLQEIRRE
tara:strand:- start:96 stop:239 length:144 start_codon:yes stop_codon:yes gene_type:complete